MSSICKWAKSDTTPCVIRDGENAYATDISDQPICVGCERRPSATGIPVSEEWRRDVAEYKRKVGT